MAPPNRRSNEVDRRASMRYSVPRSMDDTIDEEDICGLESVGVSDGFRPPHVPNHIRISSQSSQVNSSSSRSPRPLPPSTSKPMAADSFALRHDGRMESSSPEPPIEFNEASPLSRTTSVSTDAPIIVPDGPYQGPTRPSHPYQMYPQDSRPARAGSIATTATFPASDPGYSGPNGPTHPYGMYPQSTAPEAEAVHDGVPAANIPVGFPGLAGDQYQRRFGPDGEEAADIIGPDGHTEQLPPYTKYPDEVFARKLRPPAPTDGAGGIGLATRNPEFSSREDLANSPLEAPSRQSTLSGTSGDPVAPHISEKPPENKWKMMAKQKVCGFLPVWALALIVAIIIIIALLVGNVFGVLMTKHRESDDNKRPVTIPSSGDYYTTVTTTIDATPLSTLPTGLPALPTGTFSFFMGPPQSDQALCLESTSQSPSWSCDMPPASMRVSITSLGPKASNVSNNAFTLILPPATGGFSYGTQPPIFNPNNVMNLVRDYDDPSYGPAWFFQLSYNKLVILPKQDLSPPSSRIKRDDSSDGSSGEGGGFSGEGGGWGSLGSSGGGGGFPRHSVVQGGATPWFCYWNGTLLEAFLYPNVTSEASLSYSSNYGSASSAPSSTGMEAGYERTAAESSATAAAPVAAGATTNGGPSSTAPGTYATSSPSVISGILPPYPNVIKIEERRMPRRNYDQPYCVQMQISADGSAAAPVRGADGKAVVVHLDERAGSVKRENEDGEEENEEEWGWERRRTKRDSGQDCHCAWIMG